MSELRRRTRFLSALALALLVAGLGALSAYRKVLTFQPLGFQAQQAAGRWQVRAVTSPDTGLRAGDGVVLVGGEAPRSAADLRARLLAEPTSELAVLRDGQLVSVAYLRPAVDVDWSYVMLALIGAAYLLIGLYTLLQGGPHPTGIFYLWCVTSAAVYLFAYVPTPHPDQLAQGLYALETLARIFLPALTLHLFLRFPATMLEEPRWSRLVPFLYLPSTALAVLQADLILADGRYLFGEVTTRAVRTLDQVELALMAVSSVAAVAILVWRLARHPEWEQRRQLQWVALGLGTGFAPFALLYALPWALRWGPPDWLATVAVVPLALVPLTFAYAILRYKLWDLEVILRDALAYTATLVLGGITFSLLYLSINRGVPAELWLARGALYFSSGLLVAGVLVPTQRSLRSNLSRIQYRGTYHKRRASFDLGRELLEERNLDRLCDRLLDHLADCLELPRVSLYLVQDGQLTLARSEPLGPPPMLSLDTFGPDVWQSGARAFSPVGLPGAEIAAPEELFVLGYRYAFPLTLRGKHLGLLVAGYKRDQTPFNSDDLELVSSLLGQVSLALENAQLLAALEHQLDEVTRLKQHSEQILESSPAGIAVLDEEERVVSSNAAFAHLAGVEPWQAEGRSLQDFLPIHPIPEPEDGLFEVSYHDRADRERYLQVSVAGYRAGGRHRRVLVLHDVTDRVEMEHALEEKERLAALGMLAAGVAHEVNTPITGISSYAQLLLADTPEDDPRHELLRKMERQTFRAARIVNNLLTFARNKSEEPRPVRLDRVLHECVDLLGERLQEVGVEVVWEVGTGSPVAMGSESDLEQVFTNLVTNAIDAMSPGGGRLTLKLEREADWIRATVEDTGSGIPRDQLEKIFQPFYSTKVTAGGTGLGLSITYQIVRRLGGTLRVISEPGEGTSFIVELHYGDADRQEAEA